MTSDSQRLRATLVELERQLADLENVDPSVRDRLQSTIEEIETLLNEPPPATGAPRRDATITEQLTETVTHFEESHPTFAGMLGSVIDTLGRMGI